MNQNTLVLFNFMHYCFFICLGYVVPSELEVIIETVVHIAVSIVSCVSITPCVAFLYVSMLFSLRILRMKVR
jgi:hypothetical protein